MLRLQYWSRKSMANDEKVVEVVACSLLIIWLFIEFILSPLKTIIGSLNGDLNLEPLKQNGYESVQEQIRSEQLIQ